MTTADIPPLLADLGAGAAAITALIVLAGLVAGAITRAVKRSRQAFHEATVATIRSEIPAAMASAVPQVTRDLVRDEVARAVDPVLGELRPNGGGSSLRDQVDRLSGEMRSVQAGQRKIFAHLDTTGSLDDADDPDDDTGQT